MKQRKRVVHVILSGALVLSMTIGGIAAPTSEAKVKKASLKVKTLTVQAGKKKTIKIKNKLKSCKYTFKSNKKKVAVVSSTGVVKGVKAGSANITVREAAKKGKGKVRKLGVVKVKVTPKKNNKVTTPPSPTDDGTKVTPQPSTQDPIPTDGNKPGTAGAAVKVYMDEIKDENLIAEAEGVGFTPSPEPEPEKPGEATPEPTPAVIFDVNAEDGESGVIQKRGNATLTIVDGGANNSKKAIEISTRSADWHGAEVDISKSMETGNQYEISFYAKQKTGADSKIDLSLQYTPEDGDGTKYDGISQFDLPNDTWTKCEATLKVPAHVGTITMYWQTVYNSNNSMDFYLDEFIVKGVAKSASDEESTPDLSTGLVKEKIGNPVMTSRLTADPWAMEYNGRIYVYGTNDSQQYAEAPAANNNYAKIKTLNCYSSADMVNWTDHGTIAVAGSKGAAKWAGNSWAPAACHKTINGKEKFFLYFANSANSIGVLTADSPTGPWTDPIGKALIDRSVEGCAESEIGWLFDPAVLVDTDGTGYLYFGGIGNTDGKKEDFIRNPKCARVVKLGADMVSVDGAAKTIDAPFMFEDSGINKIGGKYYYSYCTNWTGSIDGVAIDRTDCPTANIAVMVSDSPMGEYKYVGCVLKNPGTYFSGASGNNHHCFTEFKGQMYAFYHTKRDSLKVGTKEDYRTTYADKLNMGDNNDFTNKDGSIADTKMTTGGADSVADLDPYQTVEAETFAMANKVGTILNTETSSNKDWLTNYSIYNGEPGAYVGLANVEFGSDGASEIMMKLSDTTMDAYKEQSVKLSRKVTGKHTIYFVFGKCGVQMDSWSFRK